MAAGEPQIEQLGHLGRGLLRDFGEVEQLQVSSKGPGDFVSRADLKAEQTIRDELTEERPNYGWVGEESTCYRYTLTLATR